MQIIGLEVEPRQTGKGLVHSLRRSGYVPAIVYGGGRAATAVKIKTRDFQKVMSTGSGRNNLLRLEGAGAANPPTAVIKEVQVDPVGGSYLHVDFQEINLSEKLHTTVPVTLVGEHAVESRGGIIQHQLWEVEIECLPIQIPDHIRADVGQLNVGDSLTAGQLSLPEGVVLLTDAVEVVVSVVAPKRAVEEEPAAAEPGAAAGAAEPEVVKKGKEKDKEEEKD